MIGLLFLNGEPPSAATLAALDYTGSFVVCADGAYNYLSQYCVPDVFVGDFDSIRCFDLACATDKSITDKEIQTNEVWAKTVVRLPTDKDCTDGHEAMKQLIAQKPDKVLIYGATGKAADHELANYSLLYYASLFGVEAVIKGEMYTIYFATKSLGGAMRLNTRLNARVSVVPFSDSVHILKATGLKYEIFDERYDKCHIKSISNTALSEQIEIEIASGSALVFVEN